MSAFRWLLLLFLSLIQSVIGIIVAQRRKLPPLLGGIIGFLFIPIFFRLIPVIAVKMSDSRPNNK
ncbi:hypothetical protein SAMN02745975_03646 [Geosporobacter subterraneus DSM 17957]|uniref:Uncharacterized protein n=1 Tax=Geosporobacter subterraneus DSM 17957 TaxID=1121919 RepID=A0A1M6PQ72_9FIRM|nr:hypothetical protein [Geosporobacter subterraneus]SHK10077.1 hypothetical protein SAMN02745975_03646 [Geosporobacter subterraneus DSM 17957]